MKTRRLLFLSQQLPFPPDGGAKIRTFNTLKELAKDFDITALCFIRWKKDYQDRDITKEREALAEHGRIHTFPLPQSQSRIRFAFDHLRALLSGRVYTRFVFASSRFADAIRSQLKRHRYDLVHADSLDLSGHFDLLEGLPIVCVHHDVQSSLLARRASRETSLLRRTYTSLQATAMQKEEELWIPNVALNVAVSPVDRDRLRARIPEGTYEVFPNGVDTDYFFPKSASGAGLVFVGGTSWFPNLDALHFFCGEVLPILRQTLPDLSVTWVGRATDGEIKEFSERYDITLTGHVPDVRPYLWDAGCVIVPIRVGGGTRIKILDAWASGKAVVSTTIGCEGLDAEHDVNMRIADSPQEFAANISEVLSDDTLARRLGEEGRRTAVNKYSWTRIGDAMRKKYHSLISQAPTS